MGRFEDAAESWAVEAKLKNRKQRDTGDIQLIIGYSFWGEWCKGSIKGALSSTIYNLNPILHNS